MPGAVWVGPSPNIDPGAMGTVYGVVTHIQAGTEAGTEAWEHNRDSDVSSHFLLPRAGGIRQMVDTGDKAWCQAAGNPNWLSVECEGVAGDTLTPAQIDGLAQILVWAHRTYGVPLRVATTAFPSGVAGGGLAWHSLGGVAWSPNRHNCPGAAIVAQLPDVVTHALVLNADSGGSPMADTPDVTALLAHQIAGVGTVGEILGRAGANYARYDAQLNRMETTLNAILAALQTQPVPGATPEEIARQILLQIAAWARP